MHEQRLRAGRELLRRRAAERRARVEPLARDLDGARGERGRVEEPQVPRLRAHRRVFAEAAEDLLHLVDREAARHVEHDLRLHRLARAACDPGSGTRQVHISQSVSPSA